MRLKFYAAAISSALLLLLAVGADAKTVRVTVGGTGARNDCAKLLEWKQKDKPSYDAALEWEYGYLSGAAMFGPQYNPLKDTDLDEVERWFVNYCTNHLEENLSDVGDRYIKSRH